MEPRVSIQVPDPSKIHLLVRLAAPARRKGRIEQAIIRRFLRQWHEKKTEDEAAEKHPPKPEGEGI